MSGLVSAYTAEEWDGMAKGATAAAAELDSQAKAKYRAALRYRELADRERAEQRRRCKHPHTHREERGFSDDAYSEYKAPVTVCDDCGEWWR